MLGSQVEQTPATGTVMSVVLFLTQSQEFLSAPLHLQTTV